jgi:hypothetical protein
MAFDRQKAVLFKTIALGRAGTGTPCSTEIKIG